VLKEGLIRPDQDVITTRSTEDYFPANNDNRGKTLDVFETNNVSLIRELIYKEPIVKGMNYSTHISNGMC
jgi:hypothetical protein